MGGRTCDRKQGCTKTRNMGQKEEGKGRKDDGEKGAILR